MSVKEMLYQLDVIHEPEYIVIDPIGPVEFFTI